MPRTNKPKVMLDRLLTLYGGESRLEAKFKRDQKAFDAKWNQNIEAIGRVLRAHLVVEHFLGERLAWDNPKLGSFDDARLSYAQKIELLQPNSVGDLMKPALRRLGAICNRLAHRTNVAVTAEDRDVFLNCLVFSAKRRSALKLWPETRLATTFDPLEVMEEFATMASSMLQPNTDDEVWQDAMFGKTPVTGPAKRRRVKRSMGAKSGP